MFYSLDTNIVVFFLLCSFSFKAHKICYTYSFTYTHINTNIFEVIFLILEKLFFITTLNNSKWEISEKEKNIQPKTLYFMGVFSMFCCFAIFFSNLYQINCWQKTQVTEMRGECCSLKKDIKQILNKFEAQKKLQFYGFIFMIYKF